MPSRPHWRRRSFSSVIDLTHTLSPEFRPSSAFRRIAIERRYTLKKDGANVNWWHVWSMPHACRWRRCTTPTRVRPPT